MAKNGEKRHLSPETTEKIEKAAEETGITATAVTGQPMHVGIVDVGMRKRLQFKAHAEELWVGVKLFGSVLLWAVFVGGIVAGIGALVASALGAPLPWVWGGAFALPCACIAATLRLAQFKQLRTHTTAKRNRNEMAMFTLFEKPFHGFFWGAVAGFALCALFAAEWWLLLALVPASVAYYLLAPASGWRRNLTHALLLAALVWVAIASVAAVGWMILFVIIPLTSATVGAIIGATREWKVPPRP